MGSRSRSARSATSPGRGSCSEPNRVEPRRPSRGASTRLPRRGRPMNGKSMAMLALAVLSGLGAMFGTSRMLAKNQGKAAVETQEVLVATRDLKVEEILTPDLVKVVPMAKGSVPAGTFTSYKDIED